MMKNTILLNLFVWSILMSPQYTSAATMESIATLPATPSALFADNQQRLILLFTGKAGLGTLVNGAIETITTGPITSAAPAPQGGIYFTRDGQLLHLDTLGTITEQSTNFTDPLQSKNRIALTPDRCLWVESANQKLAADGTLHPVPQSTPVPLTTDIYANPWTLAASPTGGTQVLVLPANAPQQWQAVPLNSNDATKNWDFILADQVGSIWLAGTAGLRRFTPNQPNTTDWQVLSDTPVTSLGPSPNGLALVGYASGELVEIDVDAENKPHIRTFPNAPEAIRCTYADTDGGIWAATATQLYRYAPAPDAWQNSWQPLGRLPGGNHDIFSVELSGKLYTAGGLTAGWGYSPQTHVFDELFAYEANYNRWAVVSHMPFPLCYNGLAVLNQTIWVVGGSANLNEPDNPDGKRLPLDTVHFYDLATDTWTQAPSLNIARNEPTVLAAAGRLYAIGGSSPDGPVASVESIAPGETAWRFETPIGVPFNQAAGCVLDGILYCINKAGFFAYDPVTAAWDNDLPQLKTSPQAALVAAYRDKIWVMGGSRLKASHRYNPASRQWLPAPDLPTDQSWGAAHALGDRLIIAGGAHWSETHQTYIYEDRSFLLKAPPSKSR
jgi:hypothetical protein